jgi:hypothetical protein
MMNPIVMKMLTDAHMADVHRQIEHQRDAEKGGHRGPRVTLPIALAALLVAAVIGSDWIA